MIDKITKKRICWINQYNRNGKFYFYRIEIDNKDGKCSIACDNIKELIRRLEKEVIIKEER